MKQNDMMVHLALKRAICLMDSSVPGPGEIISPQQNQLKVVQRAHVFKLSAVGNGNFYLSPWKVAEIKAALKIKDTDDPYLYCMEW